eukprot:1137270-Pelagomonas_calceolata.AAC.3
MTDALLRRLLSTLVTKIRHGLQLVTLLIPIDTLLLFLLVKGIHGASALGILFSLVDVGSVFTASVNIRHAFPRSCENIFTRIKICAMSMGLKDMGLKAAARLEPF